MPEETPTAKTGPKIIGGHGLSQADIDTLYGPESPLAGKFETAAIYAALTERLAAQRDAPKTTAEGERIKAAGGFVFGLSPDPVAPDVPAAPTALPAASVGTPAPAPSGILGETTPALTAATEAN